MSTTTQELEQIQTDSPYTLAILTTKNKKGKVRGNFDNFKDLSQTGTNMGFQVYVLPIDQLNTRKKQLQGLFYDESKKKWIPSLMPFPHLIYNRIPYRQDEASKEVRAKIIRISKRKNVKLFNPTFFNKWELFKWLSNSAITNKYLPETKRLKSLALLESMLTSHKFLYLKPESGKAGKGIMTVRYEENEILPYALSVQRDKNSSTIRCLTLEKLWAKISKESTSSNYIIQQGIELTRYNGRSYDLRLLIQKNKVGKWEVSGMGARLAGALSITTHVPRGGSIESPVKLLEHSFSEKQAATVIRKCEEAVIQIASQIESESKSLLAEMSMDVGIDKNGDIWFFEANSKPMKFDEPHIRKKSLQRIFQFGQFLLKN